MLSNKKNRAFTLVELLVVISIIALMLAILMPSLAKARRLAKNVICQSNLRQIGLGVTAYVNEYKGAIPYSGKYVFMNPNNKESKNNWIGLLTPYLSGSKTPDTLVYDNGKVSRVWMCPEYKASSSNPFSYMMDRHIAYANNGWPSYPNTTSRKIYQIPGPGSKIMFADAWGSYPDFTDSSINHIIGLGTGIRHNNKANCLMVDCHVDWDTANASYNWLLRFTDVWAIGGR